MSGDPVVQQLTAVAGELGPWLLGAGGAAVGVGAAALGLKVAWRQTRRLVGESVGYDGPSYAEFADDPDYDDGSDGPEDWRAELAYENWHKSHPDSSLPRDQLASYRRQYIDEDGIA